MPRIVKIPNSLIEKLEPFGPRFIKVEKPTLGDDKSGKRAVEHAWQEHPYEADDPEMQSWLAAGNNYGTMAGRGIVIIDFDTKSLAEEFEAKVNTLIVQSGGISGEGRHAYMRSDATENGLLFNKDGKQVGNIQVFNKYVVGPESKHNSGGTYKIIKDVPLEWVSKADLESIFGDRLKWTGAIRKDEEEEAEDEKTQVGTEIPLGLLIDLSKLKERGNNEHQGAHPLHGSSTGNNFTVNVKKNVWHCFRCNSGGGGLMWIAVKHGVIQCHEAHKGILRGLKFIETVKFAKEEGFQVKVPDEEINPDVARFYEEDKHGKPKFMPAFVAQELLKENAYVTQKSNLMSFRYNPENGVYEVFAEAHIQQEVRRKLGKHLSINRHKEILHFIKSSTIKDMPSPPEDLIVVANGVLNIKTGQLEPFNPDYFMFNALPVKYDSNADCHKFKTFLAEVIPSSENVQVLQEFVGYCLTRNCKFEKAVMLVGGGANGKTTFLKVLIKTLGKQNVSTMPLQIISNNRFALAELYGKMANIYPELPAVALKDTGLFKALVTGEMISGEKKFMGRFDFVPYSKLAFSCNEMPQTPDNTDAFFRRWVIIPFPVQFLPDNPKTDPNLEQKLTTLEELSGILNWALQGLKRLLQQGKFSISETVEETRNRYTLLSNPAQAFAERRLVVASGKVETKDAVYNAFIQFCGEHNLPTISKNAFSMQLPQYIACTDSRSKIQGKSVRVWRDIKLVSTDIADIVDTLSIAAEKMRKEKIVETEEEEGRTTSPMTLESFDKGLEDGSEGGENLEER